MKAPDEAPLAQGAEAVLVQDTFLGRPALRKHRVPKPWRHPGLDLRLRNARTRDEAHLLLAARRAGVPVPVVFDVDRTGATILMEHVAGPTLRAALAADAPATARRRLAALGGLVALLHDAGLTHGDLTTSNVLVPDPEGTGSVGIASEGTGSNGAPQVADPGDAASLVLIDFGLGQATQEDEPRAVDLHLVEEALHATEPDAAGLVAAFLDAYRAQAACAPGALRRLEALRERGRYR